MKKDFERRFYKPQEMRLQVPDEGQPTLIGGHAAVFNQRSEDLGGFVEQIAPGAFASSIASRDIRALLNHNADLILGRSTAGTLRLVEDDVGLNIEIDTPDTSYARDLLISMGRGDIREMSFGFLTLQDHWEKIGDVWVRTLMEVELHEVSPVTFPAYGQTTISARSMDNWKEAQGSESPPPDPRIMQDEHRRLRLQLQRAS
ncbi:MAG: HK97 family phage prohead protease [Halopseudomonas sp.]|uniref:HK97 family phage prohead protease n=1 Tax=Halopseudomonas sp. TaxID=2901191 RepID=UPI003002B923